MDRTPPLHRIADLAILLGLVLLVFGIVWTSGNMTSGPRLVDETQIFELVAKSEVVGFAEAASEHIHERTFSLKRFFPVYLIHKVLCVWLYGTNVFFWSLHMSAIGAAAACVLFLAFRQLGSTTIEAFGVTLLVVLGEQSVVWWRLFNGENLGLLFLAASLLAMARGLRSEGAAGWDTTFVVCALLASMCKESYVLVLPALGFWRIMLVRNRYAFSLDQAWRRDRNLFQWIAAIFIGELLFIGLVLRETSYQYTGYAGFDIEQFLATAADTLSLQRSWPLWLAVCGAVLAGLLAWYAQSSRADRVIEHSHSVVTPIGVATLVLVPQWLLYMRSGFEGLDVVSLERFLLPAMLGIAAATAAALASTRTSVSRLSGGASLAVQIGCVIMFAFFCLQQFSVAQSDATNYAKRTELEGRYFERLITDTEETDPITVVYNARHVAKARRLSIVLTEYLDRNNLRFLPITYGRPLDDFYDAIVRERFAYNDYLDKRILEQSVSADDATHADSKALIVLHSPQLGPALEVAAAHWFDPACYEAQRIDLDDILLLSRNAEPCAPKKIPLRNAVRIESIEEEDGIVRISGYALSSVTIAELRVFADENEIRDTSYPVRRQDVLIQHPEFQTMYAGFSASWYVPHGSEYPTFRIEAIDADGAILVSGIFDVNHSLPASFESGSG